MFKLLFCRRTHPLSNPSLGLECHAFAHRCPDNLCELQLMIPNRLESVQRRPNIKAECWQQAELW
jgi:hypothetical protein